VSLEDRHAALLAVAAMGAAVVLGRWPVHWHRHPVEAVVGAVVIGVVAAGMLIRRTSIASLGAAALLCLLDAAMLVRRWTVHLPLHCHCLHSKGAPAILGWGGVTWLADIGLTALAIWLARSRRPAPVR
jgi:hypothetical protein